jgi:hypothetical protein
MSKKLLALAQRRQALVLQAQQQRAELAEIVEVWRPTLQLADKAVSVVKTVKQHPYSLLALGAALFTVFRPHGIGRWFGRGLLLWKIVGKIKT